MAKKSDFQEAIDTAKVFIKKAEEYLKEDSNPFHSKLHASAKRASMDLTNVLVKIRK